MKLSRVFFFLFELPFLQEMTGNSRSSLLLFIIHRGSFRWRATCSKNARWSRRSQSSTPTKKREKLSWISNFSLANVDASRAGKKKKRRKGRELNTWHVFLFDHIRRISLQFLRDRLSLSGFRPSSCRTLISPSTVVRKIPSTKNSSSPRFALKKKSEGGE